MKRPPFRRRLTVAEWYRAERAESHDLWVTAGRTAFHIVVGALIMWALLGAA